MRRVFFLPLFRCFAVSFADVSPFYCLFLHRYDLKNEISKSERSKLDPELSRHPSAQNRIAVSPPSSPTSSFSSHSFDLRAVVNLFSLCWSRTSKAADKYKRKREGEE